MTTGQPSTNPRVVKEADALFQAGYDVHVIGGHWAEWADRFDEDLFKRIGWKFQYVGGFKHSKKWLYTWTRARYKAARILAKSFRNIHWLGERASGRVLPELIRSARSVKADLYIAHYLPALIAAYHAAKAKHAKLGFDAEDFHSGQYSALENLWLRQIHERIERQYIPLCDFVTCSSPLIGEAYASTCHIHLPTTLLNVFPMPQWPAKFRNGGPDNVLRLFWFSQSIAEGRGLEDVLKAMALLRSHAVELHLLGRFLTGYREKVYKMAEKWGLPHKNIIVYEPIQPEKIVNFGSGFDIGLALETGRDKNNAMALSNKIFTYILSGNAVIGTDTEAQRPIINGLGEAGWLYRSGDTARLAEGIARWQENRDLLYRARLKSLQMGTDVYNWDKEKKKLLELVERALSKDPLPCLRSRK